MVYLVYRNEHWTKFYIKEVEDIFEGSDLHLSYWFTYALLMIQGWRFLLVIWSPDRIENKRRIKGSQGKLFQIMKTSPIFDEVNGIEEKFVANLGTDDGSMSQS